MNNTANEYTAVYQAVDELLARKGRACIAIDGRCASGKTTFSGLLAEKYDASVIHTDDFFLPIQLRTTERLSQPGGNIHYERFMEEVLHKIKSEVEFNYRRFDCSVMDYKGLIKVLPKPVVIIEGAYCLRPDFRDYYDLKLFMSVSQDEQAARIKMRNGEEAYDTFSSLWIPMEENYIDAFDIVDSADICINSKSLKFS